MPSERAPEPGSPAAILNDGTFITELRQQMHRFAMLQLGDQHWAEDAVQEALVGALQNAGAFGGRAALKTWVFAILKHKIADVLRQKGRLVDASSLLREGEDNNDDCAALFDSRGHWRREERPLAWGDPEWSFGQEQFWRVFEACLENLPPQQARVFMMREFIGLQTKEICAATNMTTSNLFVVLHRARLRLRECLENNWYAREGR